MIGTRSKLALASIVLFARLAWADGTPDPNFGTGGIVTTTFAGPSGTPSGDGRAAVVQPDGRVVVAGLAPNIVGTTSEYDFVLARYESNGSLDATFGTLGRVATDLGGSDGGYDVAIQPDGKLVVAGSTTAASPGPSQMASIRYLTNGTPDPTFGTNGSVRLNLPGGSYAVAMALQPDGAILLAGHSGPFPRPMTVVRLLPSGALDPSFGTGGVATADASGSGTGNVLYDMAVQADGRIVVTGFVAPGGGGETQVATVRFTTAGLPDNTFGLNGVVRTNVGPAADIGLGLAIQPDGRILVAGYTHGTNEEVLLIRYAAANGALDPTFGSGGIAALTLGASNQARAVVVQPDGKITVAGLDSAGFLLARFTSSGALDPTFGTNGIVRTNTSGEPDECYGLSIPFPGALLAVGQNGFGHGFALVRYTATTPVTLESLAIE